MRLTPALTLLRVILTQTACTATSRNALETACDAAGISLHSQRDAA